MRKSAGYRSFGAACMLGLSLLTFATGCQLDVAGQTLPSPYWLDDDVQYFPPGLEFKLSREAAALNAAKKDASARGPMSGPLPAPAGVAPAPAPGPGVIPAPGVLP